MSLLEQADSRQTPGMSTLSSAFHRELELMASVPSTIVSGICDHVTELKEHPGEIASMLAGGLAVGAAFAYAAKNPEALWGACGFLSRNAGKIGAATIGLDIGRRVGVPMADTFFHSNNLEHDKKLLGANLGAAVIDYPLMGLATYAGSGAPEAFGRLTSASKSVFAKFADLGSNVPAELAATNGIRIRVSGSRFNDAMRAANEPDDPGKDITPDPHGTDPHGETHDPHLPANDPVNWWEVLTKK